MERECRICHVSKPIEDFPVRSDSGKRRSECSPCNSARTRAWVGEHREHSREYHNAWRKANPERVKRIRLQERVATYGLTVSEYEALLSKQDHTCAICHKTFDARIRPHIDHDHGTGAVRGILCSPCNRVLGMLGDDEAGVMRFLAYLTSR